MHMPSLLTRLLLVAAVPLTLLGATTSEAFAQAPDAGNDPYEWKWAFPLLGDNVAELVIKVRLPWGIGLNYVCVDQPIDIDRIAVGVNDSEMVDISELIKF